MPKILQVARFTTPVSINSQDSQQQKPELPLHEYHKLILEALDSTPQPLTVREIVAYMNSKSSSSKVYRDVTLRSYVLQLARRGKIFSRTEEPHERQVRAGGGVFRKSVSAALYSTKNPVPQRTVAEVIPGIILVEAQPWSKKKKEKQSSEVELIEVDDPVYPSPGMSNNTMVDYLIEKIVAERTAEIQEELDSTRAELNRLRDFLKSAI